MDPTIWGPHFWYILHIITFNYPDNPTEYQKRAYHDFFTHLKEVIPCGNCRKHYSKYIGEYPLSPHLDSKVAIIKWLIQIHNFVNISLGKPIYDPVDVINIYKKLEPVSPFYNINTEKIIKKKKERDTKKIHYILISISLLIIIFTHFYYQRYYFDY
tara:strand:+ start:464 stop:934 length:471 start_codon:yes stop_codon:yes gene_type:complete